MANRNSLAAMQHAAQWLRREGVTAEPADPPRLDSAVQARINDLVARATWYTKHSRFDNWSYGKEVQPTSLFVDADSAFRFADCRPGTRIGKGMMGKCELPSYMGHATMKRPFYVEPVHCEIPLRMLWLTSTLSPDESLEVHMWTSNWRMHRSAIPKACAFSSISEVESVSQVLGCGNASTQRSGVAGNKGDIHAVRRKSLSKRAACGILPGRHQIANRSEHNWRKSSWVY